MSYHLGKYLPAWVEINLKALRYNFSQIQTLAKKNRLSMGSSRERGGASFCPVVLPVIKADAYGHGMKKIGEELENLGSAFLGVSDVAEGVYLREQGIRKPILLFESTLPDAVKDIVAYRLVPTICSFEMASALQSHARRRNSKVAVHISVDTGMSRLGVDQEKAEDFFLKIAACKNLLIQGIYTHFPVADTDPRFTRGQIESLRKIVEHLKGRGLDIPYVHAANSMGLIGYRSAGFLNLVRPGLMLYGLYPKPGLEKFIDLKPLMSVKSRVIMIRRIPSRRGVSYGHTFKASREMTVATLSIGYNDGYLRFLSNKAHVLIGGKRCQLIGRVTMDQVMVDASAVRGIKIGDEAVLLGCVGRQEVTADELARAAATINYEITCCLGNRLPRIYKS